MLNVFIKTKIEVKFKFTTNHKKITPQLSKNIFSGFKSFASNKQFLIIKRLLNLNRMVKVSLHFLKRKGKVELFYVNVYI